MQIYEVRIGLSAQADMERLRIFLDEMLSEEGAVRYANNMRVEIKMLAIYTDCYGCTTSKMLRMIHPKARRMVSHNQSIWDSARQVRLLLGRPSSRATREQALRHVEMHQAAKEAQTA